MKGFNNRKGHFPDRQNDAAQVWQISNELTDLVPFQIFGWSLLGE